LLGGFSDSRAREAASAGGVPDVINLLRTVSHVGLKNESDPYIRLDYVSLKSYKDHASGEARA